MKMKLKKGDAVIVVSGKDKGKAGTISEVLAKENKIVIDGVAVAKRSVRGKNGQTGRIMERAMPIHMSNVMLAVDGKPSRVGRRVEDGKIVRYAKKGGAALK